MSQKVTLYLFPASILAAAYAFLPYFDHLPANLRSLMPAATYLVLASGIMLSLHFNRSRACFVLLMLVAFYWICSHPPGWGSAGTGWRLENILCFLLPVNLALFCLMREKGIFTSAGRKRLLFLLLQGIILIMIGKTGRADAQQGVSGMVRFVVEGQHHLPGPAFPVIGFCAAVMAVSAHVRQSLVDSAFLGTLAALAIIFGTSPSGEVLVVFLLAAGLILNLSILQESHNMAYRDDLTGLLSRRALNEQLEGLGRRFTIAMLDLDYFKRVNDTYGHDVGDQVLRMAAARIREAGGGGTAYRYGGEEFTIIFPGKRMEEVLPHLEELREEIAAYRFRIRGWDRPKHVRDGRKLRSGEGSDTHVSLTISIGVAESDNRARSSRAVLASADEALYRAKQKGRNRVGTAFAS